MQGANLDNMYVWNSASLDRGGGVTRVEKTTFKGLREFVLLAGQYRVETDVSCGMYGGEMIHGFGGKNSMERKHLETLATDET